MLIRQCQNKAPVLVASFAGGDEDSKCYIHAGPPFKKIKVTDAAMKLNKALVKHPENCHVRGSVHCIRYNA
jgi:hypothetical protein